MARAPEPDGARQIEPHRGAFAGLRIDLHMAAGLLGETEHHGKAKAGAHARRFRGEERLERPRQHLRRHAGAGIRHRQHHVIALASPRRAGGHSRSPAPCWRPRSSAGRRPAWRRGHSAPGSAARSRPGPDRPWPATARPRPPPARRCARPASGAAGSPCRAACRTGSIGIGAAAACGRTPATGGSAPRRAWPPRSPDRHASGRLPRLRFVLANSRLSSTTVSRLLKSCAMPPVSWPIACSRCESRAVASARTRSVVSVTVSTKPPSGMAVRRSSKLRPSPARVRSYTTGSPGARPPRPWRIWSSVSRKATPPIASCSTSAS